MKYDFIKRRLKIFRWFYLVLIIMLILLSTLTYVFVKEDGIKEWTILVGFDVLYLAFVVFYIFKVKKNYLKYIGNYDEKYIFELNNRIENNTLFKTFQFYFTNKEIVFDVMNFRIIPYNLIKIIAFNEKKIANQNKGLYLVLKDDSIFFISIFDINNKSYRRIIDIILKNNKDIVAEYNKDKIKLIVNNFIFND